MVLDIGPDAWYKGVVVCVCGFFLFLFFYKINSAVSP